MISLLLAVALQDPGRVEALERQVADLQEKVAALERLVTLLMEGNPRFAKALKAAKETSCANNLRQLWAMQMNYSVVFGGRTKQMPPSTGADFWLALSKTEPPMIEEEVYDIYVCPFSGEKPRAGFTSYRGPAKKVGEIPGAGVVGCCVHADGSANVLYKSGDVKTLGPDDPATKAAIEGTQGLKK